MWSRGGRSMSRLRSASRRSRGRRLRPTTWCGARSPRCTNPNARGKLNPRGDPDSTGRSVQLRARLLDDACPLLVFGFDESRSLIRIAVDDGDADAFQPLLELRRLKRSEEHTSELQSPC